MFDAHLPPDIANLLNVTDTARVLSVLRAHRCQIEDLPPGARHVVDRIIHRAAIDCGLCPGWSRSEDL